MLRKKPPYLSTLARPFWSVMGLVWFVAGVTLLPLLHQWQHAQDQHHLPSEVQRIAHSMDAAAQDAWDALELSDDSSQKQSKRAPLEPSSDVATAAAFPEEASSEKQQHSHAQAHKHGTPHTHSNVLDEDDHSHGEPIQGSHFHGEGSLWHFGTSLCPSVAFTAVLSLYPTEQYRNQFASLFLHETHAKRPAQPRAPPTHPIVS